MDKHGKGDPEVVSLMKYNNDIRFPAVAALRRYWEELRGPRQVPARAEIDPRAIEDTLEFAFILERIAPGVGRFRLAGMHLNDLMGMEVRGMPLSSLILPEHRAGLGRTLERVFTNPATALLTLTGERGIGRAPMDAQLLMLPLASDFGDVSRVLGCLCTLGPLGRSPRRFAIREEAISPVQGICAAAPAPHAPAPAASAERPCPATPPGFNAPATGYTAPPRAPAAPARPRLRLVRRDGEAVSPADDTL